MENGTRKHNITGFSRIYNIDARECVPDSVVFEVEKILAGSLPAAAVLEKTLFGLKDKMWDLQSSYFELINRWPLPYDFMNHSLREVGDIAALMALLIRVIPIVSKQSPKSEDDGEYKLGRYISDRNDPFYAGRPHIELFSDKIRSAGPNEEVFRKNCVTTLIHELSHAVMDPLNYHGIAANRSTYEGYTDPNVNNGKLSFYTFREESLADTMMFLVVNAAQKGIRNQYFNQKKFSLYDKLRKKPLEYKASLSFLDRRPDFGGWIRAKASGADLIPASVARAWMVDLYNHIVGSAFFLNEDPSLPWV